MGVSRGEASALPELPLQRTGQGKVQGRRDGALSLKKAACVAPHKWGKGTQMVHTRRVWGPEDVGRIPSGGMCPPEAP